MASRATASCLHTTKASVLKSFVNWFHREDRNRGSAATLAVCEPSPYEWRKVRARGPSQSDPVMTRMLMSRSDRYGLRNQPLPTYCRQATIHCITQVTGSNLCTEIFSCGLLPQPRSTIQSSVQSTKRPRNQATIRQISQWCEYACGWLDNKEMTQTKYLCPVVPRRFHFEP